MFQEVVGTHRAQALALCLSGQHAKPPLQSLLTHQNQGPPFTFYNFSEK